MGRSCRGSVDLVAEPEPVAGGRDGEAAVGRAEPNPMMHFLAYLLDHLIGAVEETRGTVIPSPLAALRLTTSSKLVGCWTGRSEGFSPRKILSTYAAARLCRCRPGCGWN